MKKKNKNQISEYKDQYLGQEVIVHVIKPMEKKVINNGRNNTNSCPNCLSKLVLDEAKLYKCSGDHLKIWEGQFIQYNSYTNEQKLDYIKTISHDSIFFELYDKWLYSINNNAPEEFNCGYTNKIFLPIPSGNVTIPDPVQVTFIEKRLGRVLTEEELYGESDLFYYQGVVFKDYRQNARKVKITLIRFPEDV